MSCHEKSSIRTARRCGDTALNSYSIDGFRERTPDEQTDGIEDALSVRLHQDARFFARALSPIGWEARRNAVSNLRRSGLKEREYGPPPNSLLAKA
jgi:hypothetical protein